MSKTQRARRKIPKTSSGGNSRQGRLPHAIPQRDFAIMPYSWVLGQDQLKAALEIAYIEPALGGVLLSGQRGTGKSTVVRAFSRMIYERLPVTLPINATEDRVIGGWKIDELLRGKHEWQKGLLEEAHGSVLYVDEINLLDDHIVNIILDVTSTGVLNIEREGRHDVKPVHFTLIGTMNPSEGGLRPQLIDRFGVMADVVATADEATRKNILLAVLEYDLAHALEERGESGAAVDRLREARARDAARRTQLEQARQTVRRVDIPDAIKQACVRIGRTFGAEGHRGDYLLALAARALGARDAKPAAGPAELIAVAPLVLQHRRSGGQLGGWSASEAAMVQELVNAV
jgi:magnesium chelatase subunit I